MQSNGNNSPASADSRQSNPAPYEGRGKGPQSDTTYLSVCVLKMRILFYCLSLPSKEILGGQQAFHSHRASGVESSSRHPNFSSKTIPETVTEPCRCIDMNTRAVYPPQELLSQIGILCNGITPLRQVV